MSDECKYCRQLDGKTVSGNSIRYDEFMKTAGYHFDNKYRIDYLDIFIMKNKDDKKAGLMIDNGNGYRYIDINYCPMCGRKLGDENERFR